MIRIWPTTPTAGSNPALALRRTTPWLSPDPDGAISTKRLNDAQEDLAASRHNWAVANMQSSRWWGSLADRRNEAAARLGGLVWTVTVDLETPLVVGFGGAGAAVDTSLLVHPTHGYPYLPGSTLKGAAKAACAEQQWSTDWAGTGGDDTEPRPGTVTFFDAVPCSRIELSTAVMTPHHKDYYIGDQWPADYEQPVPIEFLVVNRGQFRTHLHASSEHESHLETAAEGLSQAGRWLGFGAKTASGFGYANITTDKEIPQ